MRQPSSLRTPPDDKISRGKFWFGLIFTDSAQFCESRLPRHAAPPHGPQWPCVAIGDITLPRYQVPPQVAAAKVGAIEVVTTLCNTGADVQTKDEYRGWTALQFAAVLDLRACPAHPSACPPCLRRPTLRPARSPA